MLSKFVCVAIPVIIQWNLSYCAVMINIMFASKMHDEAKLAGVGLGVTITHVFGLCPLVGLNVALETLVSQGYGYGNYQLCGQHLNKARAVLVLAYIPLAALLLCSAQIFESLGQDPKTMEYTH